MKSAYIWLITALAVMGIVGYAYAPTTVGTFDDIQWSAASSDDEGSSLDHGMNQNPSGQWGYVSYDKPVAATDVLRKSVTVIENQVEVTYPNRIVEVTYSNVYPHYASLLNLEFTYSGGVLAELTDVVFEVTDDPLPRALSWGTRLVEWR